MHQVCPWTDLMHSAGLGVRLLQCAQTAWLPGIYAVLQPHQAFVQTAMA